MAAETSTTISLQARDWESIIGITREAEITHLRRVILNLQMAYSVAIPPRGSDLVAITTTEKVLVKIAELLFSQRYYDIYVGTNNLNRIITAIKALNTDGYINTEVTTLETNAINTRSSKSNSLRSMGREILLIDITDNN